MNKIKRNNGITGFQLKLVGALLMVFDHIHQMFIYWESTHWMHMLGRLVMPIFLFTCAEGYHYTKDRKKYALRLLIGSILMTSISYVLNLTLPIPGHDMDIVLMNNVFMTLFLAVLLMTSIDAFRQRQWLKGILLILLPALPILFMEAVIQLNNRLIFFLFTLIPSYFLAEGGILMILLAASFYLFRQDRLKQFICLGLVALISTGFTSTGLFSHNVQWMMIFSFIFILLYNGQRGKGSKYFFYIFYPGHIYLLYFLSYLYIVSGH